MLEPWCAYVKHACKAGHSRHSCLAEEGMGVVIPQLCVRARVLGNWLTLKASRRLWRATPRYSFWALRPHIYHNSSLAASRPKFIKEFKE